MAPTPGDSIVVLAADAEIVNEETSSLAEQVASSVLKDDENEELNEQQQQTSVPTDKANLEKVALAGCESLKQAAEKSV